MKREENYISVDYKELAKPEIDEAVRQSQLKLIENRLNDLEMLFDRINEETLYFSNGEEADKCKEKLEALIKGDLFEEDDEEGFWRFKGEFGLTDAEIAEELNIEVKE